MKKLRLDSTPITDLAPIANMVSLARAANSYRWYFGYGLSFSKCPVADLTLANLSKKRNPEATIETITYLRQQQGLPPLTEADLQPAKGQSSGLVSGPPPIENVPTPFAFHLSRNGKIGLLPSSSNWPLFPSRTSEQDHSNRLDACRTLADDLISELGTGKFQAREEYSSSLRKYASRLPKRPGDGNVLLADAEARTLRNLFAAEADILAIPFASKLKTFLEQHIGLRVFYPEISKFYRDVQSGRIEDALSLDAVDGFVRAVEENTPAIFDVEVRDAVQGSADEVPEAVSAPSSQRPVPDGAQPMPPKDPLGDVDPQKAWDFTFAGVVNGLWKAFIEGENVNKAVEGWKTAGVALRPHVNEILEWLQRFIGGAG